MAYYLHLIPQMDGRNAVTPSSNAHITADCEHPEVAFRLLDLMCKEEMTITARWGKQGENWDYVDDNDLVIYALFSRPFRPIGFLDFHSSEAKKVSTYLKHGINKSVIVSFGSPYFGNQYFERALTYVNAYSMLSPSVKAFVRAAVGEIPFEDFSPVEL